jgi:sulfotransferase family protein
VGKILWLASYPRSGNTWLRAFLHNLFRNSDEPYDINRLQDFTLIDSDVRWYRALDPRPPAELTKEEVAALRPRAHAAMTAAFPDTVFVKTHSALVEDRGTPMITLEHTAGAIYVIRNPLDIAVSYSNHYGVSLDEAVAAMNRPGNQSIGNQENFVYELHGSWTEHVRSWTATPNPALHVVRYEDMACAPQRAFGSVVRFLGLQVTAARIAHAIEHSSFSVLREQELRKGFRERSRKSDSFFDSGQVGRGALVLAPSLIESLQTRHAEQMARFGYGPQSDKPV